MKLHNSHGRTAPRRVALSLLVLFCTGPATAYAQSHEPPPRSEQPERQEPPPQEASHDAPGPGLFIRAFGAVNWGATNEPGLPNSFALGQFALFATSPITERISVLAEVVMEASRNTRVVTDLERLQLTFRMNDSLHLAAGRYHTAIGYYNSAFHHGSYFEAPILRPRVFAFEDEGGVLAVHEVGVRASGAVPNTGAALNYVVEVGNGRSWEARGEDIDAAPDTNAAKSTNVGLSFRPTRWRGIEVGTSFYRDQIPRTRSRPVDHRVTAAFLVYKTPSVEIMAEWLRLWHRIEERTYANHGGYLQASKAWGALRPYYRYDRLMIHPATPFIGQKGSYSANIIGLRADPVPKIGIKAEYERGNSGLNTGINVVRTQLVFVF